MSEHTVKTTRLAGMRYRFDCQCTWSWTGTTNSPGSRILMHLEEEGVVAPEVPVLYCPACRSYFPAVEASPCLDHDGEHMVCLTCAVEIPTGESVTDA